MARCSLCFEHRMSRDHRESRLALYAPQAQEQHQHATAARGRICGASCVQIGGAGLLFAHFPGSQP
ncbi:hypothetical protein EYR05_20145 [Xanthomonas oryzae pv. oryzae]|nr:hypothetical protein EYR02_19975 [Xanthomonas oryzae pv. oryzae]QBI17402.1 hypothetical protein EYR03_20330 [Xanthomonas oryzae pv. oryzae]TAO93108.1 hypothetical protein EYR05_20145 [Xanthomonas oryzae pv. oryzae]TAP13076.1 hypothetical protein EYR04_19780 [Xanthomonas oryzae pv. oryzae]